jgi:glucose/arabinose dehydrogenase
VTNRLAFFVFVVTLLIAGVQGVAKAQGAVKAQGTETQIVEKAQHTDQVTHLQGPPPVTLEIVADGFSDPVYVTAPPYSDNQPSDNQPDDLYVVNRSGTVGVVSGGQVLSLPFLDVSRQISLEGEMGLLSLAFHPEYADNGRVFVLFTRVNPFDTVIAEFRRDPKNPYQTEPFMRVVFSVPQQPESNIHRGGHLEFGPDGKLYVSSGDAGLALKDDPSWNGKVYRLDVDAPGQMPLGAPYYGLAPVEPYATGFRNAWRFSFDGDDLYVGDVGSSFYEEINLVQEGKDYGWPYAEGSACATSSSEVSCDTKGLVNPIYSYRHVDADAEGGSAVIGGYVYRGSETTLNGYYVFGDMMGRLWALAKRGDTWQRWSLAQPWGGIVSLGKGADGELYALNITNGTLYRLVVKPTNLLAAKLLQEKPETIALDGFAEFIQDGRWAFGPSSKARFYFETATLLKLEFGGDQPFINQELRVVLNGEMVLEQSLSSTFSVEVTLPMQAGVNELHFEVSRWQDDPSAPYALHFTTFELTSCNADMCTLQ